MILQTIKKGVRNDTFEESQVIQCFDVIIEKDMLQISNAESSDEESENRQKNFNKAKELIGAAGLCRDNIIWYLGDPPLEKNVSLTVVTLDTVTYISFIRQWCQWFAEQKGCCADYWNRGIKLVYRQ